MTGAGDEGAKRVLTLLLPWRLQSPPWILFLSSTPWGDCFSAPLPGERGIHSPHCSPRQIELVFFSLPFRNLLYPQVGTLSKMFQIIATAWDGYWLFIYQGIIFCLFSNEFHRFTSLVQNSAVRGEAKQKSSKGVGAPWLPRAPPIYIGD